MDLISRIPRILATCLGLLGVLAVGGIGGTIVASLAATPPATAQGPPSPECDSDECETSGILWWKHRHCSDNPEQPTNCRMDGSACVSGPCTRQ